MIATLYAMSTRKLRQKDGAVYFATFSCHEWVPHNRAGALQTITLDGTDYVRHVAYNAKGQRTLLAMGNDMMTRYAYDPLTYRLLRIRTEKYEEDDHAYEPQSGTTKRSCSNPSPRALPLQEKPVEHGFHRP